MVPAGRHTPHIALGDGKLWLEAALAPGGLAVAATDAATASELVRSVRRDSMSGSVPGGDLKITA
jgi:hypothetical protein